MPIETIELTRFEETTEERPGPAKNHGSAPPKRGLCRRCGQNKPVNRLMLCYPCWVKSELEDKSGWRESMPHPDWCHCALPEHGRRSYGN